jgi:hypothetical protein
MNTGYWMFHRYDPVMLLGPDSLCNFLLQTWHDRGIFKHPVESPATTGITINL